MIRSLLQRPSDGRTCGHFGADFQCACGMGVCFHCYLRRKADSHTCWRARLMARVELAIDVAALAVAMVRQAPKTKQAPPQD